MNKNLEQAEQVTIKGGASSPGPSSSKQHSLPLTDGSNKGAMNDEAVYGDASIPYVPALESKPLSWQMAETSTSPRLTLSTPREPEVSGSIVLLGIILGAGLGALLAYFTKASLLSWAWTGAAIGGAIAFVIFLLFAIFHDRKSDALLLYIFEHWLW